MSAQQVPNQEKFDPVESLAELRTSLASTAA